MSNSILYDPVLVRELARELDVRLRGRPVHPSVFFESDLSATLLLGGGECLRFDLHPTRGWIRLAPAPTDLASFETGARVTGVSAPPDERILRIGIEDSAGFGRTDRALVVELQTNQWNALLTDRDGDRIVNVLRGRDAGERSLRIGEIYAPPPPSGRYGADAVSRDEAWDRWRIRIGGAPLPERLATVLREFAWVSSLSARAIMGPDTEDPSGLEDAFERWWRLRGPSEGPAVLLDGPRGSQPFPCPLPGIGHRCMPTLMAAMSEAAASGSPAAAEEDPAARAGAVRTSLEAAERRVRSLRRELERSGGADALRRTGDLILAHLHRIPAGASSVRLPGWDGEEVDVELDPGVRPHQNAEIWYDRARRRSRAEARIPPMIEAAETEVGRWREAERLLESGGGLPPWAEIALRPPAAPGRSRRGEPEERRPYRLFRTSGGIEVRVGRSAADNDRLTFGHSAPNDVWLHARSVAGSHVILRWPDSKNAPPARDLAEAAALAALFSKARTSGLVAVDWTRRKHVRKPRGAAKGAVTPIQARTIFVEPDPALEARLLAEPI